MIAITRNPVDLILAAMIAVPLLIAAVAVVGVWWEDR